MLNRQERLLSLLINDRCEPIVLLLHLLDDFLFNSLLLKNSGLHFRALAESKIGLAEKLLKLTDLVHARLLQGHASAALNMIIEVAVIAESHVTDTAVGRQGVLVLAHGNLRLRQVI